MAKRSKAREVALQVLYEDDLNPGVEPVDRGPFLRTRLQEDENLVALAQSLVDGVRRNRSELDAILTQTAEHWSVERMAATDRNVLRLAAYEIMYTQTPRVVAINEAIDLAKRFGTAQSSQFVNGILDKLLESHKGKSASD